MPKILAVVLGIAAGALGGALIFLIVAFTLYDPGPESWDYATPIFIFLGAGVAALAGGGMGAAAGINVAEGHTRRGLLIFAITMGVMPALPLLGAIALWGMIHMPARAPRANGDSARSAFDPGYGVTLAHQLLDCHAQSRGLTPDALARGGCKSLLSLQVAESNRGTTEGSGWRWQTIRTPRGPKVIVRPADGLAGAGPIFEFDADGLLVRRDAPNAQAFAVEPPIPAVDAYRECLVANGTGRCGHMVRERGPAQTHVFGPGESHSITLTTPEAKGLSIRLFPKGRYMEGRFELHVQGRGRRYMFQQGGDWHATSVASSSFAYEKSPPPAACERDERVPCPSEQDKLAGDAREELYKRIATRIGFASALNPRERVIVRFDPQTMPGLERAVEADLRQQRVELLPYGPVDDFEARLKEATVYVWLPTSVATPADQSAALARWTDAGGRRHEVHAHWMEGTLDLDGHQTTHERGMDTRYLAAAETDATELLRLMDRAISALSIAEVRVTSPAGTDLRFRTMGRPFNRQLGSFDAGRAKVRIDRHIEIPPGVLRVAPLETSVNGVMAFPSFWIRDGVRATSVRLEFTAGRITRATAAEGQPELENYLRAQPALMHFREFCLGINPLLAMQRGDTVIPYYGYGAGVVRMSLGDNEELGGAVRGGAVRWNFFVDATVRAGDLVLVKDGRLVIQ